MRDSQIGYRDQEVKSFRTSHEAASMWRKISQNAFKQKERVGIWAIGLLANKSIVYVFDYLLYPFVIWKCGIVKGGVVMTLLSFLICWVTFIFYDWAKRDWIGIETMKELKEYEGSKLSGRLLSWVMKKGEPVTVLLLSVYFDPFITTAYMRRGAHVYNGLRKRDWEIFVFSLLFGNLYWTLIAYMGVTFLEFLSQKVYGV